jgi:membrane fusion protein (multidrug efflux system)
MKKYLFIFFLVSVSSCDQEKKTENDLLTVTVEPVKKETVYLEDTYPASTIALQEVELRADVSGYVTNILFNDGQRVKKGQLLYEIDKSRYQAQMDQSHSSLRIAKANYERVQRDVKRYEMLKEGNAIAGQIYDNALTDLSNAEQEMIAAQAAVDDAMTNLRYSDIKAPFDGTIGFSAVRLGALVNPGQTLLNVVSADDPMGVDFYAAESDLYHFQGLVGNAEVLKDSVFTIALPGGVRYPFPGKIENIDRAVDRGTGTIMIRLAFPNPELTLKPGLSATLIVRTKSGESAITIPQRAKTERMGETYVFVVHEDTV